MPRTKHSVYSSWQSTSEMDINIPASRIGCIAGELTNVKHNRGSKTTQNNEKKEITFMPVTSPTHKELRRLGYQKADSQPKSSAPYSKPRRHANPGHQRAQVQPLNSSVRNILTTQPIFRVIVEQEIPQNLTAC